MPEETITCPSCSTTLRPKTPVAAGTRIKCPKCTTVFTVPGDEADEPAPRPKPKPAPRQEEPDDLEETSAEIDDEPEGDSPVRRKTRRPIQKKGVPLWVWLTAGGGVFLLLCCAGCAGFAFYFGNAVVNAVNAGSGSATLLNYAQIQQDMSEGQVKTIMGAFPQAAIQLGPTKTDTWQSGTDTITVTFVNDKAVNRACHLTSKSGQVIVQSGFAGK